MVILSKFIIDDLLNISSLLEVCLAGSADGIKDDLSTFAKAEGYGAWDEV
ncbi:MAG: hypothetical protein MR782_01910 [Campylobacter sp.]|nr:hypothetical protein [Campylobacter sp.]